MKIVDIKKFLKSILFIIGSVILLTLCFSNISFSRGEIKTKDIFVSKGDTLWTIAEYEQENNKYYDGTDIRSIIYEIKKLNNLDTNKDLDIGQKLLIYCI